MLENFLLASRSSFIFVGDNIEIRLKIDVPPPPPLDLGFTERRWICFCCVGESTGSFNDSYPEPENDDDIDDVPLILDVCDECKLEDVSRVILWVIDISRYDLLGLYDILWWNRGPVCSC